MALNNRPQKKPSARSFRATAHKIARPPTQLLPLLYVHMHARFHKHMPHVHASRHRLLQLEYRATSITPHPPSVECSEVPTQEKGMLLDPLTHAGQFSERMDKDYEQVMDGKMK